MICDISFLRKIDFVDDSTDKIMMSFFLFTFLKICLLPREFARPLPPPKKKEVFFGFILEERREQRLIYGTHWNFRTHFGQLNPFD